MKRALGRIARRACLLAVTVAFAGGQAPLGPGGTGVPLGPGGGQNGGSLPATILLTDAAVNLLTDSAGNLLTQ